MAVTITKDKGKKTTTTKVKKVTKLVPESAAEATHDQLVSAELVDEYLALTKELDKHDEKVKTKRARAEELKKMFVGAADEFLEPADVLTLLDTKGDTKIEVSAKANQTTMADMADIKKALGTATFMEIAKVNVSDLKAYLPKDKYEQVTSTAQTGARKLKVI